MSLRATSEIKAGVGRPGDKATHVSHHFKAIVYTVYMHVHYYSSFSLLSFSHMPYQLIRLTG